MIAHPAERTIARVIVAVWLTACSLACVACGGGDDSPSTPPPSGTPGGGTAPRIAWDQVVPGGAAIAEFSFNLYVDNQLASLADRQCAAPRDGVSACSGRLPSLSAGTHSLQLSALLAGIEGPKSQPLTHVVGTASSARQDANPELRVRVEAATGCADIQSSCFVVQELLRVEGPVVSIAALDSARVLLVDGMQIRVAIGSQVLPEAALIRERDDQRLVAAVPDSRFETTHFVYVASVERSPEPTLTITRYREVQNVLGEPAVVVFGVPVGNVDPRLALDDQGRIYVALPAETSSSRRGGDDGTVLRYAADGTVPWSAGQRSPRMADGLAHPTAIAFDPVSRMMWLGGSDLAGSPAVVRLETASTTGEARATAAAAALESIAVMASGVAGDPAVFLSIDGTGALRTAPASSQPGSGPNAGVGAEFGTAVMVASRAGNTVLLTRDPDSAALFRLVRLTRVAPTADSPRTPR